MALEGARGQQRNIDANVRDTHPRELAQLRAQALYTKTPRAGKHQLALRKFAVLLLTVEDTSEQAIDG